MTLRYCPQFLCLHNTFFFLTLDDSYIQTNLCPCDDEVNNLFNDPLIATVYSTYEMIWPIATNPEAFFNLFS